MSMGTGPQNFGVNDDASAFTGATSRGGNRSSKQTKNKRGKPSTGTKGKTVKRSATARRSRQGGGY